MAYTTTFDPSIQSELASGERLLWTGRPKQGFVLRASDLFLIPFSLLWAGFIVFWTFGAWTVRAPSFFLLWAVPFLLVGLYMTVGRFIVDAWVRSRTTYALTDRRALIISESLGRTVKSLDLRAIQDITLEMKGDGSGTILFGQGISYRGAYRGMYWPGASRYLPPMFEFIPDARRVYDMIMQVKQAR